MELFSHHALSTSLTSTLIIIDKHDFWKSFFSFWRAIREFSWNKVWTRGCSTTSRVNAKQHGLKPHSCGCQCSRISRMHALILHGRVILSRSYVLPILFQLCPYLIPFIAGQKLGLFFIEPLELNRSQLILFSREITKDSCCVVILRLAQPLIPRNAFAFHSII